MEYVYEPALLEYMEQKGKKNIIVELVSCENSDIEITDLHVYIVDDERAKYFKEKKRYRSVKTSVGEVLLPVYKLDFDEKVIFGLKTFWIFKSVKYSGIRL